MTDHYATLALPRDASIEQITRAWREAASAFHPDRPGGDAEKFKAARQAYEVLSDPEQRMKYDTAPSTDAPLVARENFDEMSLTRACRSLAGVPMWLSEECPLCDGAREVRVEQRGFWTRQACPGCS